MEKFVILRPFCNAFDTRRFLLIGAEFSNGKCLTACFFQLPWELDVFSLKE